MEIIKVSSKSNPNSVAGAITNIIKEKDSCEIRVIGAGALNQAIKAIIISRGFIAPFGKSIYVLPSFEDVEINEEEKTMIKLQVISN